MEPASPDKESARLRWSTVAKVVVPVALVACLAAGLSAADEWLPLFPRELGQFLTERFLRFMLIGYVAFWSVVPFTFGLLVVLLLSARGRRQRRPLLARMALLLGSSLIMAVGLELVAIVWMAWVHRLPRLPVDLPAGQSSDGSLSLVVIGGSSAMGYPYDPTVSVGKIVAWQLGKALSGRGIQLDILANLGRNLEEMHVELTHLTRRPDALIVYSGHNEFLSRFDTNRDAGYMETHQGAVLGQLYRLSLHSPFCLWVYETVRKHRLGGPPPLVNQHRLIDSPSFTGSELHQLRKDFRRRLEAIVQWSQRIGTVPILVIPPANESGYEPNRTVLTLPASAQREAQLVAAFKRAHESESRNPVASIAGYQSLISDEPEFAEAHFRLARLLEQSGDYDQARTHYLAAKDLDGFPVRCRSDFIQIYHDVSARYGCILIDSIELLRGRTAHGILDDSLFHDAHHPTFASQVVLAQAIMDSLRKRQLLGLKSDESRVQLIDLAECVSHFHINRELWRAVCVKAATYYKHLASARFDPSEREAKHHRILKAAAELQSGGARPEEVGIPGIGLAPIPNLRFDWWSESPVSTEQAAGQPHHASRPSVR